MMETTLLPLKQAPMDGTPIYVRTWDSYRYQPYSPKSQEYKRGIPGRWQTSGEYGGWQNCQAPKGALWSADHTVFDAVDARLAAALSVQKQLVDGLAAAERAMDRILPYLIWTVGEESPGHHPTLPSAVGAFKYSLNEEVRAAIQAAKASS